MINTKFTPGPWVIKNGCDVFGPLGGDSGDGIDCYGNDGWQVAEVGYYSAAVDGQLVEICGGPRLANIALIKAAPDLYAELYDLLPILEHNILKHQPDSIDNNHYYSIENRLKRIQDALSKARGENK